MSWLSQVSLLPLHSLFCSLSSVVVPLPFSSYPLPPFLIFSHTHTPSISLSSFACFFSLSIFLLSFQLSILVSLCVSISQSLSFSHAYQDRFTIPLSLTKLQTAKLNCKVLPDCKPMTFLLCLFLAPLL